MKKLYISEEDYVKKKSTKKLRPKNLYFSLPIMIIFINCFLIICSWLIQSKISGLKAWEVSGGILSISLFLIIMCLIVRIVFCAMKKINISEFFIGSFLNFTAFYFCFGLIIGRIVVYK